MHFRCGKAWGQYLEDHRTTVQTRNSLSLALNGNDFDRAIRALIDHPQEFSPYLFLRAWFNATTEADVRYVELDAPPPAATGTDPSQPPDFAG